MRISLILYIQLLICCSIVSQDFTSPVLHEIKLAGTFGELRSNHFHMGIDIKSSNRSSGDPILAAQSGFISRINVSRSGYGNAVYIDHPSGHTTVYGHLRNFSERLDSLVRRAQREEESFEVDIHFDSLQVMIKQGEEIGNMGNSGSSYGPHLHFEIRDTKSEAPLNPMRFGLEPVDQVSPIINNLRIFSLDDQLNEISDKTISASLRSPNQYVLNDQKIGAWRIGMAVQTYDPMNSGYNKNGIYKIVLLEDGVQKFISVFDSISFDDTRFINAHIDYPHYKKSKARYHRCYVIPGNRLPVYMKKEGVIKLFQNQSKKIEIQVYDYAGNKSTLTFNITRDPVMENPQPSIYNYLLPYGEPNIVKYQNLEIFFPEGSLYQDAFLFLSSSESEYLTDVFHIGDEKVPLHKPMKFYLHKPPGTEKFRDKACIIECSKKGEVTSCGGKWEGEYFIADIPAFGNYTMAYDTIPPTITDLNGKSSNALKFKIEDNLSVSGGAKGLEYQATIDGKWALFEYDLKTNRITHRFADPPDNKDHTLVLEVTDDRGNTRVLEKKFYR